MTLLWLAVEVVVASLRLKCFTIAVPVLVMEVLAERLWQVQVLRLKGQILMLFNILQINFKNYLLTARVFVNALHIMVKNFSL